MASGRGPWLHRHPPMCTYQSNAKIPVAMRPGGTPVPIPNTMVKTWAADDTILETVWESRRLPDLKKKKEDGLKYRQEWRSISRSLPNNRGL